tara:strand:- start:44 stop:268 length:225 start_codon:yes stop_codon:yes gene_type:complete
MDSVFNYVSGFFKGMTSLLLVLLSFGVMAEIIFGSPVFGMSVIDNVMNVVNLLGNNGFVGLVVLIILFKFAEQK